MTRKSIPDRELIRERIRHFAFHQGWRAAKEKTYTREGGYREDSNYRTSWEFGYDLYKSCERLRDQNS